MASCAENVSIWWRHHDFGKDGQHHCETITGASSERLVTKRCLIQVGTSKIHWCLCYWWVSLLTEITLTHNIIYHYVHRLSLITCKWIYVCVNIWTRNTSMDPLLTHYPPIKIYLSGYVSFDVMIVSLEFTWFIKIEGATRPRSWKLRVC